jgi:hypothetical protein
LAEVEITSQKLLRRAYERNPVAIAKWQRGRLPEAESLERNSTSR